MNPLAELEAEPWAFDFHTALRRLDCAYPDRPQSGFAARPAEEPVRIGQDPSLTFAPAPLQSFRLPTAERSGRLRVAFFGLFGPQGPLPLHLTEHARDRMRGVGDRTFAAFVDMFHHRMYMLFHRSWAASQPTVGQDRPDSNPFARYLGALCGLGSPTLLGRDPIPDHAKLQFVGLLMQPGRNASGLRSMVQAYFGLPCAIEEFAEDWLELPPENRWRLGYSADVSQLGKTSIMGRKVYQRAHKFRLVLGPLDRPDYESLLPNKERLKTLAHLVRSYVGDELKWDVKLVLKPQQRRQLALGKGSRMGYDTWLGYRNEAGVGTEELDVEPPQLS